VWPRAARAVVYQTKKELGELCHSVPWVKRDTKHVLRTHAASKVPKQDGAVVLEEGLGQVSAVKAEASSGPLLTSILR
jgi:hypothetical protein